MGAIASQITSHTIVYSILYSGADQRKHQSSASLAFVRGIHRGPVNFPQKWPVMRKMCPFDDVIMLQNKRPFYLWRNSQYKNKTNMWQPYLYNDNPIPPPPKTVFRLKRPSFRHTLHLSHVTLRKSCLNKGIHPKSWKSTMAIYLLLYHLISELTSEDEPEWSLLIKHNRNADLLQWTPDMPFLS